MTALIRWFAGNPVAANLLMALILAGGLVAGASLVRESMPELGIDTIQVRVAYPGGTPDMTEERICIPIENALRGLPDAGSIRSRAVDGAGFVYVEVPRHAEPGELLDGVKVRVDAIASFPPEAEAPVVERVIYPINVLILAVSGETEVTTLKRIAERVRDDLAALHEISEAELDLAPVDAVAIEVSREALRRHGLSLESVAQAVRRSSLDVPAGALEADGRALAVRAGDQAHGRADFERLVLLRHPDGTRVILGDVADLRDGVFEPDLRVRLDGRPAVLVRVSRAPGEDLVELTDAAKRYVASAQLPDGVDLTVWHDGSLELRHREGLLARNGLQGLVLVLALLALVLRFRVAFWVAAGIPVAFLGATAMLPALELSINLMSLFAFLMALGLVVDDAIVVGESIHTEQRRVTDPVEASTGGATRVALPVFLGAASTVLVLAPLLWLEGIAADLIRPLPYVIGACLAFSLVESLLILPAHMAHGRDRRATRLLARSRAAAERGFEWLQDRVYVPALQRALEWRHATVAGAVGILLLTLGLVTGGWLPTSVLPSSDTHYLTAALTLPPGTSIEATERAVQALERSAVELRAEYGAPVVEHYLSSVGVQPWKAFINSRDPLSHARFRGPNLAEVRIRLSEPDTRDVRALELARRWRELAGPIPSADELLFLTKLSADGYPIHFELRGRQLVELRAASGELHAALQSLPGVRDVHDSLRNKRPELRLRLRPEAEALGVSLADLAGQVRDSIHGIEVQRFQRGSEEVRVWVRYPRDARSSQRDLEELLIRAPGGALVPLEALATTSTQWTYPELARSDFERLASVTADLDPDRTTAADVIAPLTRTFLPELVERYPGMEWSLGGEQREQGRTIGTLAAGTGLAILAVYVLFATALRSYVQPLLILSAVPFGFVGAIAGHVVLGLEISNLTLIGTFALAGVLVNGSLVLCDAVARRRAEGHELEAALELAGIERLRPIALTSATTFLGLTPLLLESSIQADFLKPVAAALSFGVALSTVVVLLLVPALYLLADDAARLLRLPRR